jgi:hypothetical protein
VIRDSIEARRPVEALWEMITDAAIHAEGSRAILEKEQHRLVVRLLSPIGAVFAETPAVEARKLAVRLAGKITKTRITVSFTLDANAY